MKIQKRLFHALMLLLGLAPAFSQTAPEPNPPYFEDNTVPARDRITATSTPGALFSIGNPTDEEQFFLELINRARLDATAEANRLLALDEPNVQFAIQFFGVDTNVMKTQFTIYPPVPPLSFNAKLMTAARGHSQYQFDTVQQTHSGPGTNTLVQRLQAVGYSYSTAGENVYTTANNVEQGHAGFEIDWGNGPSGMQTPPGHRNSIHSGNFREIGIGIVLGSKTREGFVTNNGVVSPFTFTAGPMVVTEDFGSQFNLLPYITGVAYYDVNGNNFYDLGEGLGGITVTIDGVNTYAVTASSGGYSIPVPANRSYTVRFKPSNGAEVSFFTAVTTNNVKIDYRNAFAATDVVSAPSVVFTGVSNLFEVVKVPAANGYRARITSMQTAPIARAVNGLGNLEALVTGTNPPIVLITPNNDPKFRLAHDTETVFPMHEIIQFARPFRVSANARVDFKSRVGVGSSNQIAKVEVSNDDGQTWATLWSQAGKQVNGGTFSGELEFFQRSVSLANYANQIVRIRFSYNYETGSYFPVQALNATFYGWAFDEVTVVNAELLSTPTVVAFGDNGAYPFAPIATGNYYLEFQAFNGAHDFPWGARRFVTAQSNPPSISMLKNVTSGGGSITLQFTVNSGTATPFALNSATSVLGPWNRETAAVFSGPTAGSYSVTVPTNSPARYYRVLAN